MEKNCRFWKGMENKIFVGLFVDILWIMFFLFFIIILWGSNVRIFYFEEEKIEVLRD